MYANCDSMSEPGSGTREPKTSGAAETSTVGPSECASGANVRNSCTDVSFRRRCPPRVIRCPSALACGRSPTLRRESSGVRTTACSVLRFPTETWRRRPRCARADANPAPRRLGALTTRNPSRPSSQEMCFACFDALLSHLHGDRTPPPAPAYVNHLWCVRALLSLLPARLASRPPAS